MKERRYQRSIVIINRKDRNLKWLRFIGQNRLWSRMVTQEESNAIDTWLMNKRYEENGVR